MNKVISNIILAIILLRVCLPEMPKGYNKFVGIIHLIGLSRLAYESNKDGS